VNRRRQGARFARVLFQVGCITTITVRRRKGWNGSPPYEVAALPERQGIGMDVLEAQLQREGAESFVTSWHELMDMVATKARAYK
jgi:hypothetical protein